MAEISVIVPVYNVDNYIEQCVESVVNQKYSDFELLLIDDGSKDRSGKICDRYAENDARIKVVHQQNKGVSVARNVGVALSTGKYITFLDSDDWLDQDFLETAVNLISTANADILVYGKRRRIGEKIVSTSVIERPFCKRVKDIDQYEFTQLLKENYTASSCGTIFRHSIIENMNFDPSMNFGEDLTFIYELLTDGELVFAAENSVFYNYRANANSLTNVVSERKILSTIRTYRTLFQSTSRFKEEKDQSYMQFVSERWFDDYYSIMRMILKDKHVLRRFKYLELLTSDEVLCQVIRNSGDMYSRRYGTYPRRIIAYRCFQRISNFFKRKEIQ